MLFLPPNQQRQSTEGKPLLLDEMLLEKLEFVFWNMVTVACLCVYLCMFLCLYLCMYVCMYLCIYMCKYVFVSVHVCVHVSVHVRL